MVIKIKKDIRYYDCEVLGDIFSDEEYIKLPLTNKGVNIPKEYIGDKVFKLELKCECNGELVTAIYPHVKTDGSHFYAGKDVHGERVYLEY